MDIDKLGPQRPQPGNRLVDRCRHPWLHAVDAVFRGDTDLHAGNVSRQGRAVVGNRLAGRGRVLRIMSGDRLERDCRIFHRARKWSDLIETGGEGHQPEPRDPPIGRLQADDATESGWLTDRSSGVGTKADRGETGGNRRRGPTAASARNPLDIPWVADWFEGGVLV